MDKALEDLVRHRADGCCEYCKFPAAPFHIEHIIARKHGGATTQENLALACARCNFHKGTDLSGIDQITEAVVQLFNPRKDVWAHHFRWAGVILEGLTPTGRATIGVLAINDDWRIEARQQLILEGIVFRGS
jgi:hypothetical protein